MVDKIDLEILNWLQQDSRMQWKEIGEKVHLTGQAVAARIRKLEEMGVIERRNSSSRFSIIIEKRLSFLNWESLLPTATGKAFFLLPYFAVNLIIF